MNSKVLKGMGLSLLPYVTPFIFYLIGSRGMLNGRDFAFLTLSLLYGGIPFGYSFGSKVLAARSSTLPPEPEDPTDRMLRIVTTVLLFGVLFFIAGLHYNPEVSSSRVSYLGLVLFYLAMMGRAKALRLAPYLDPMHPIDIHRIAPMQNWDVYKLIRHPAQASTLLYSIAAICIFLNVPCTVICVVVIVLTFVRTAREDRYLSENLAGYQEYKEAVPKKLIPYIW